MKKAVILLCVLVWAGVAQGLTIFETFDTDPLSDGWTKSEDGSSFTYENGLAGHVGGGYLNVFMQPNPNTDRYTVALGQAFDGSQEIWMEFDLATVHHYQYQRGWMGVFNSSSDNKTNVLGANYWRQQTSSYLSNFTTRISSYDSAGTSTAYTPAYVFVAGEPVRAKMHYSVDGDGNGVMELEIWRLNEAGAADDELLTAESATLLTPGQSLSYDVFGLANNYGSSATSYTQRSWVDNLYFSTEGANPVYVDPAFAVPEPVTLALLGLGGLAAIRRRK